MVKFWGRDSGSYLLLIIGYFALPFPMKKPDGFEQANFFGGGS
jgi:hypothetical protein